jgi:6-methylsalicylate decarboxylase
VTIDVHGHITSPRLFERFPMPASLGDIEGMIEGKLAVGIDLTIVGSPVGAGTMVPMPGLDNYAQPAAELDAFHEWAAETIRSNAEHLRGYVYVNPLGGRDELDRAAKWLSEPEFVGLIVNTSVNGEYLDSPAVDDFFAMASSAGAPVLLHPPAQPVESRALRGHLGLIEHVARPCDITCGVAAILFAGWLEKYPELRLIAPNAGGALALLAEKLELAQRRAGPPGPPSAPAGSPGPPPAAASVPATPIRELLSRIYVDTATPSRLALAAAIEVFGSDHLMFGTDSPPMTSSLQDALDRVEHAPLSSDQRRSVLSDNAAALFGLTDRLTA